MPLANQTNTDKLVARTGDGFVAPAVTLVDVDGNALSSSNDDYHLRIMAGLVPGYIGVKKYGSNLAVPDSLSPICIGGVWPTPQVGSATQLRVKAGGNAADTAAGAGAREITLIGIGTDGSLIEETLATAGESASSATTQSFIRILRGFVSESGTYATQSAGSHVGSITIENAAGTEDWFTITNNVFPHGQSQIGAYTIPLGYEGFVFNIDIREQTSANKETDFYFFQRQGILKTTPPYDAMRVTREILALDRSLNDEFVYPLGPFPALTDIGFMGIVDSGTARATVDFTIILRSTSES